MLDGVVSEKPEAAFIEEMRALESAYLESSDPIEQSGFGGGPARWKSERMPLIDAIDRSGSLLDVGCANGWLAACVREWCLARGFVIEPYGVDIGPGLVELARERLVGAWVADAWTWQPPQHFTFVYSLLDLAPDELSSEWVRRLAGWVEPGGRVILGSYGSQSRAAAPQDVAAVLAAAGLDVLGEAAGGTGPITRFAWAQL